MTEYALVSNGKAIPIPGEFIEVNGVVWPVASQVGTTPVSTNLGTGVIQVVSKTSSNPPDGQFWNGNFNLGVDSGRPVNQPVYEDRNISDYPLTRVQFDLFVIDGVYDSMVKAAITALKNAGGRKALLAALYLEEADPVEFDKFIKIMDWYERKNTPSINMFSGPHVDSIKTGWIDAYKEDMDLS